MSHLDLLLSLLQPLGDHIQLLDLVTQFSLQPDSSKVSFIYTSILIFPPPLVTFTVNLGYNRLQIGQKKQH